MSFILLQVEPVMFNFSPAKDTTRTVTRYLNAPAGAEMLTILLQNYNFAYSDGKQYGFGQLGVQLAAIQEATRWKAACTASLSDDKRNDRKWDASVVAVVHYYGKAT